MLRTIIPEGIPAVMATTSSVSDAWSQRKTRGTGAKTSPQRARRTNRRGPSWPRRFAALVLAGVAIGHAHAQSAVNGKALYGIYCQVCHSPIPNTAVSPLNLIMTAANNPAQISVASSKYSSQMGFINGALSQSDLQDLAAYLGTFLAATSTIEVVEFYNAGQDHYFISGSLQEIADLDNGLFPGWARTGYAFNAYPGAMNGASPVCRFYIPPAYGDSHFYSASIDECAQALAKYPFFVYEAPNVFYINLPDATSGACPAGMISVYRLWDDRADTNHRYTTSVQVKQQMQAQRWVAEGYGPDQVIMCSPQ